MCTKIEVHLASSSNSVLNVVINIIDDIPIILSK